MMEQGLETQHVSSLGKFFFFLFSHSTKHCFFLQTLCAVPLPLTWMTKWCALKLTCEMICFLIRFNSYEILWMLECNWGRWRGRKLVKCWICFTYILALRLYEIYIFLFYFKFISCVYGKLWELYLTMVDIEQSVFQYSMVTMRESIAIYSTL